jgi:hypothetical protein
VSAATYINPFLGAGGLHAGRVDQGQDFTLSPGSHIGAIGRARILEVQPNWYQGQPAIFYELLEGPRKGQIIYVGEQINPLVQPGQVVQAGQPIGTYAPSGTGVEIGLGGGGGRTYAQAHGEHGEGETPAGLGIAKFLTELGVNTGRVYGTSQQTKEAKEALEHGGSDAQSGGVVGNVAGPSQLLVEGLEKIFKPIGTKLALYAVLILGAVGMMIFGLSELLKPVGGPDLAGGAKKIAKGAAA